MRTTDDKKENIIRVRMNDVLKDHLYRMSVVTGKSISEYIRELIMKDIASRKNFKN